MKTYFIAGTEIHSDKNYEAGSLQNYTELGFECVYTHLMAKRFIKQGLLDPKEDIVVTCEGREFLYNNHITTITWKQFEEIKKRELTLSVNAAEYIVDAALHETSYYHDNYMEGSVPFQVMYNRSLSHEENYAKYIATGTPKYKFFDEDFDIITDVNFNKDLKIPNKEYICFNRRVRKHREEYNMSEPYGVQIVEALKNKFNADIFVTGYHNEQFDKIENVKWVNLRDWCTLLNNKNCLAAVQNQSGPSNLTQIVAREKLLNVVISGDQASFINPLYNRGRRPDLLGKAVNFKKTRNVVLRGPEPEIDEILQIVEQYA